ncbi:hypothetical protein KC336_g10483 [Hortaea werneckii]|nr:hypothetical protein KC336_g10483 [Hortaea werneckii]
MQRLISDGEVLPDDKISTPHGRTLSLITIGAAHGRLNVVRYLLSQGVDPRTLATEWHSSLSSLLELSLLNNHSTLDTIIEDVNFLSGLCVFGNRSSDNQQIYRQDSNVFCIDILLRPRASWSIYDSLRVFYSVVLNFSNASARFLHLVEPALKERAYYSAELDIPTRPKLMHVLAECAGAIDEDQWRAYKHPMAGLVASGIQAGSDLHMLSKTGAGMTPLMHALLGAVSSFDRSLWRKKVIFDRAVAALQQRVQRWLTLLAMAGVDLSSLWRHCEVIALRFGSTATEWGLWVLHPGDCYSGQFWDMVEHPERSIPGAWTESEEFDPEPSVRRNTRFPRGYSMYKLLDSDRVRWPDDLDFFED